MKKALLIVLAVLISAFVPTVFAQAKSEAKQADRSVTASHEKTQVFEKNQISLLKRLHRRQRPSRVSSSVWTRQPEQWW